MSVETADLAERYREVLERIASAAQGRSVTLIAVSKTQSVEAVEALYRLGQRDFGENYVQEMIAKAQTLRERGLQDIRWHFIGHLQTNKVKQMLPWVHAVHSVDSEKLATELSKRLRALGRKTPLPVFLEVNIGGEQSKSGVAPEEVPRLASFVAGLPELSLQGLMAIPPPRDVPDPTPYRHLGRLEGQCRPASRGALSMGMTDDLEIAIQEGATHVRVGTAVFGARPKQ